ncbi:MAG TPA: protease pro-enzyme activation domain-containing protein [Bryobacteraceae bacterium]
MRHNLILSFCSFSTANRLAVLALLVLGCSASFAAVPDRITRPVNPARTRVVKGTLNRNADPRFDRGPVDPAMRMDYMVMAFRPNSAQQAELDRLLDDQQNPSSPFFHRWLTPEEFGDRFGLSRGDHSKVVAWLTSQGLTVNESARGRNWVAFSGTAAQVSRSLHTSIHRFQVDGESHFANTGEPAVPEALADVIGGFIGLNDFYPKSDARQVPADFNSGTSHYLVPEDYATIYNIAPLYKAGIDGTGQNIAIVGTSQVSLTDLRAFRTRYNLPASDPKMVLVGTDPGFNGAQIEGHLDLEWAGAIAPQATLYYVYSTSPFTSLISAINLNTAPIISVSYGDCEGNYATSAFRAIAQQGNAQGITILSSGGDSGAAGCHESAAFATRGLTAHFPADMPEVTAVGGTQFVEGTGNYWAASNSSNFGSALSYIPEAVWNESNSSGLIATGGGVSSYYARPSWQTGPGVPDDNGRHFPDVSLTSALHDPYVVTYAGSLVPVAGTSAATPSMAGIVALINHYQVSKGFQAKPGLGNINPQLYRLAQSAPSAFHDITSGDNIVRCAQGSPDCLTGSFGYSAGTGYDMASGLGSVDANNLVTLWNTQTQGVTVTLLVSPTRPGPNDTIAVTAIVTPTSGSATPTGTVSFNSGVIPLGSSGLIPRSGQQVADLFFPAYKLGTGAVLLTAQYSGDATFSSGGTTRTVPISIPSSAAAIIPSAPDTVWPNSPDAQGLSWQTPFTLREVAGVPAIITSFSVDGQALPLAQYFPSPDIPANGSVSATIVFRNLTVPLSRTFTVAGIDAAGQIWTRQFSVNYDPLPTGSFPNLTATPLIITQNTAADPACQWPAQVTLDEVGGFRYVISGLFAGGVNLTSQIPAIFGTERLDAWGSLQGTVCFTGITPPATNVIEVDISGFPLQVAVSYAAPPATAAKITATPANITLAPAGAGQTAQATLAVNLSDKTQTWTAAIFPGNRTTAWLTASQYSGTGPGQITLSANGTGFEPGAYRATVVLQSANAVPQSISIPVMFVLGGSSSGPAITAAGNAASYQGGAAPGMILSVFGTKLANTTDTSSGTVLPYSLGGVSAAVNGIAAPILYVSPTQVNLQIPYEAGSGPGVLGINNNGQIAGIPLQIAPSAPGIFADANGDLITTPSVKPGATATAFVTGAGEVTNQYLTGLTSTSTLANQQKPVLPISVTVGGVPAFLQVAGLAPNQFGTVQVNFIVPASVPAGSQPVVVTVGGVASPAAHITVQAQ